MLLSARVPFQLLNNLFTGGKHTRRHLLDSRGSPRNDTTTAAAILVKKGGRIFTTGVAPTVNCGLRVALGADFAYAAIQQLQSVVFTWKQSRNRNCSNVNKPTYHIILAVEWD
jgi:hypothetical protein